MRTRFRLKQTSLILLSFLLCSTTAYTQKLDDITKDSLRRVVCNMMSDDSKARTYKKVEAGQKVLDSINFYQLVGITKKFGFPDKKRIGIDCGSPFLLLLHNVDRLGEKEHYDLFAGECKKGNLSGWELGQALDRLYIITHKKSAYGLYPAKKPCIDDLEFVNAKRKELGLAELKVESFSPCQ